MPKTLLIALIASVILGLPSLAAETSEPAAEPSFCNSSSESSTHEGSFSQAVELTPGLELGSGQDNTVNMSGPCTAETTCPDGSTISCTSTSTAPKACTSTNRNCPSWPGSVSCLTPFGLRITKQCEPACPPSHCPDWPQCSYQYFTGTGCCVNSEPDFSCPTICE